MAGQLWRSIPRALSEHEKMLEARPVSLAEGFGRDKFDDNKFEFYAIKLRNPKGQRVY